MMKYLQRLGKSLMLPVACLPVAAILMGIGYWIDPSGWGANNIVAAFLLKAGGALVDNMAILFAIGVGVGMTVDNDGTGGLAGLVSWLTITTLLNQGNVQMYLGALGSDATADVAFSKIQTQFIGILCGIIGAACYNKFHKVKLPDFLGFFSGKRSVAIVTAGVSIVAAVILYFVWPFIYGALVSFGEAIITLGPIGAGIYAFFNRLLIPFGLHHALNSVFWFDVAGINDIARFWTTRYKRWSYHQWSDIRYPQRRQDRGYPFFNNQCSHDGRWHTDYRYLHVRFLPCYDVRSSSCCSCYVSHG